MASTEDPKGVPAPQSDGSPAEPIVSYSQTTDDPYGYNDDAYSYAGAQTGALTITDPAPPPPPSPSPQVLIVAGKVVHTRAVAGKPFSASMPVRIGGKRIVGTVRCSARIGLQSLPHAHSSVADGSARCLWTLPPSSRGKRFDGLIVASYHGAKVSRGFSTHVG
jgi:hypothetical protein